MKKMILPSLIVVVLLLQGCTSPKTSPKAYDPTCPSDKSGTSNICLEQRIDGKLIAEGSEMSLSDIEGSRGIYRTSDSWEWALEVRLDTDAACRFGKLTKGRFFGEDDQRNGVIDIFLNRPENTTIIMSEKTYGSLLALEHEEEANELRLNNGSLISFIEKRALIPIITYGPDWNETLFHLKEYKQKGYTRTIVAESEDIVPDEVLIEIRNQEVSVDRNCICGRPAVEWAKNITGLLSSPILNFDPNGSCQSGAMIMGSEDTKENAESMLKRIYCSIRNR